MGKQHVIVTGAGGGIGTQLVQDLLDRGYLVSAVDAAEENLDRLRQVVRAQSPSTGSGSVTTGTGSVTTRSNLAGLATFTADLTDSGSAAAAVEAAVERHGPPYGLANLAGNNRLQPLPEITDDDWRFLIDANLSSTFYMCRSVLPLMHQDGGRVINTSSIFGIRGCENDVAYAAAKAGVVGLTRALATEYARHQVTVNCVAPVVVLTERVKKMPAAHLEQQRQRIPLGRFSELTDVTRTYTFLLSDDGAFYTGQTFSPNGGDVMP